MFRHYKPDPETYLGAADLLGVEPHEAMMVAAHPDDLRAARRAGLRASYVMRPLERGPGRPSPAHDVDEFDIVSDDFIDLASRLA